MSNEAKTLIDDLIKENARLREEVATLKRAESDPAYVKFINSQMTYADILEYSRSIQPVRLTQ